MHSFSFVPSFKADCLNNPGNKLIAKGYDIDVRDHYTCSTYWPFILAFARWTLWNRFPSANNFALTETRKDEWELAKELLKNPYIGLDKPDYSDDPELSGNTSY